MDTPWLYLAAGGSQRSAMESEICNMIVKGTLGFDALAWRAGQAEWKPLRELGPFRELTAAAMSPWLYLGADQQKKGPLTAFDMVPRFVEGAVDGMTFAWTEGMAEWKPVSEIESLRRFLQLAQASEEEDHEGADKPSASNGGVTAAAGDGAAVAAADIQSMVFVADEEEQPPVPADMPRPAAPRSAGALATSEVRKGFVADDGTSYIWDAAAGNWVEGEFVEEDDGDDDGGGGGYGNGAAGVHKKSRQRGGCGSSGGRGGSGGAADRGHGRGAGGRGAGRGAAAAGRGAAAAGRGAAAADVAGSGKEEHWGDAAEEDEAEEGGGDESLEQDAPAEGCTGAAAITDASGVVAMDGKEAGAKKRKKPKKKKGWDSKAKAASRWVYVKGLPWDVTAEEVATHFGKCGVLAIDPLTQSPRVKLYRNAEGRPKGDASVCYAMEESIDLALQVLDGGQLRPGVVLEVSRAVFEQKGGAFDPSKRLRLNDARVRVAKAAQQQALSWNDEGDSGVAPRKKGGALRIVALENMFDPKDFVAGGDAFGEGLESDLRQECEKLGPVEKITLFSRNPLGPAVVKFATAFGAEECVRTMNKRFFGGRQLRCRYWDGVTNYIVQEDEKTESARLEEFGDWLESQELPEEFNLRVES